MVRVALSGSVRTAWFVGLLFAGLGLANLSLAQESTDLSTRDKQRLKVLAEGKEAVSPNDKDLLQRAAKFHLRRLTQKKYQEKLPPEPKGLNELLERDTFTLIPAPTEKKPLTDSQQDFLQAFTEALLPAIDEVLQNGEPIARVNAARILARLGEASQERAADDMVKVLQDKNQSDAVKFYALKGLADLFAAAPGSNIPGKRALKDEGREDKCIVALVEFLERKSSLSANAPQEEIDAFRYLRREAIRALGKTRTPAVMKKNQLVGTPTALALLRVVGNDGINPPPTLYEQAEAAISICQLQTSLAKGYQPDYAAHVIGEFIVEFAKNYNQNRANQAGAAAGNIPSLPWRFLAGGLLDALKNWKNPTPYTTALAGKSENILKTIQSPAAGNPATANLQTWLQTPVPVSSLFKGDEKSVVKPSAPAEN
jgi:hypothetical protein